VSKKKIEELGYAIRVDSEANPYFYTSERFYSVESAIDNYLKNGDVCCEWEELCRRFSGDELKVCRAAVWQVARRRYKLKVVRIAMVER